MGFNLNKYGGLICGSLVGLVSGAIYLGPLFVLVKIEINTRK